MVTTLATQAMAMHPGGWNEGWHDGGDAPAFWPVFPITFGLFWLAVLGTAFYFIRRRMNTSAAAAASAADPMAKAQSVLAERFARGEIDEDEYLMRMSALRNGA
ncbi:SHOCT domain-containing protein [Spirillospora sp. CA-142024]|uniref:SHOCT domain-containing protein n=1 Tax=Spirillospora sp. CA-142024 TaxID=3240036 RepID=UPI003D8E8D58